MNIYNMTIARITKVAQIRINQGRGGGGGGGEGDTLGNLTLINFLLSTGSYPRYLFIRSSNILYKQFFSSLIFSFVIAVLSSWTVRGR